MTTLEENLASVEGVADVSVIVPICFNNPLRQHAVDLLSDILSQRRRAIIPVTSVIGAYHIATRYLKTSRLIVKKILGGLLRTRSPSLYSHVAIELAVDALDYATVYNIESWDGYLISLARSSGAAVIYSLDKELSKIKEVTVINPFPEEKVREYHNFVKNLVELEKS